MSVMEVRIRLPGFVVSVSIDRLKAMGKKRRRETPARDVNPNLTHRYPAVTWETNNWMSVRK